MISSGTLYIVATPIGNLRDLSLRCLDILTKVEVIACEDTRHTGLLLEQIRRILKQEYSLSKKIIKPTLLSYYEHNEINRIPQILNTLKNNLDVALVSDAGTPTISDPGFKLVRKCIEQGISVESIPGPSSVISALVVSGLPTDKFLFLGYLPKKQGKRKKLLEELKSFKTSKLIQPTVIFFQSPHRLKEVLQDLKEVFGDINLVIAREMTKVHEEIRRETIKAALNHFTITLPRGEFVLLFNLKQ